MYRKVFSIGNSKGVSIPVDMLKKLNLFVGSEVDIRLDESGSKIIIEPVGKKKYPKSVDRKFISQVNEFIKKYSPALNKLAGK